MAYLNRVAEAAGQQAASRPAPVLGEGQRWGTDEIEIVEVALCDAAGQPSAVFVTGGAWQVRLRVRSRGRVEDPVFGLAVHHVGGAHICGPNTSFAGLRIPVVEGEGEIVYRVPALPLMPGTYYVSVAAHNRADTVMYDYHDRAYAFQVHPGPVGERYGMFTLGGTWAFQSGGAS
jgi:lipopolysaccharide transport system ATP-binding protein